MENKYSKLQIGIHWLVFLLVIAAYCAMEFRGFFPRRSTGYQHDPCFLWHFDFRTDGASSRAKTEISNATNCA